jgi:hypothetical protein
MVNLHSAGRTGKARRRALGIRPGPCRWRGTDRRPPGARSVQTTWQELIDAGPDVVLVTPCGFHPGGAVERARTVAPRFPNAAVWGSTRTASWFAPALAACAEPRLHQDPFAEADPAMSSAGTSRTSGHMRIHSAESWLLDEISRVSVQVYSCASIRTDNSSRA